MVFTLTRKQINAPFELGSSSCILEANKVLMRVFLKHLTYKFGPTPAQYYYIHIVPYWFAKCSRYLLSTKLIFGNNRKHVYKILRLTSYELMCEGLTGWFVTNRHTSKLDNKDFCHNDRTPLGWQITKNR